MKLKKCCTRQCNPPFLYCLILIFWLFQEVQEWNICLKWINPLSPNLSKWSNTLNQLVGSSRRIVCVCLTILWDWCLKGYRKILPRVWLHFGLVRSRLSYLFWPNWRLNLHGLKIDCQSICAHLSLHKVFWKVSYHCEAWLFIPGRKRRKQKSIVH